MNIRKRARLHWLIPGIAQILRKIVHIFRNSIATLRKSLSRNNLSFEFTGPTKGCQENQNHKKKWIKRTTQSIFTDDQSHLMEFPFFLFHLLRRPISFTYIMQINKRRKRKKGIIWYWPFPLKWPFRYFVFAIVRSNCIRPINIDALDVDVERRAWGSRHQTGYPTIDKHWMSSSSHSRIG